jgi:hypothetical protein
MSKLRDATESYGTAELGHDGQDDIGGWSAELDVKRGTVRRWFNVAAAPGAHFPEN